MTSNGSFVACLLLVAGPLMASGSLDDFSNFWGHKVHATLQSTIDIFHHTDDTVDFYCENPAIDLTKASLNTEYIDGNYNIVKLTFENNELVAYVQTHDNASSYTFRLGEDRKRLTVIKEYVAGKSQRNQSRTFVPTFRNAPVPPKKERSTKVQAGPDAKTYADKMKWYYSELGAKAEDPSEQQFIQTLSYGLSAQERRKKNKETKSAGYDHLDQKYRGGMHLPPLITGSPSGGDLNSPPPVLPKDSYNEKYRISDYI